MIFKSTYPDVTIPSGTVYDYVFGSLTKDELERVAVVDGERKVTYGDLRKAVDAFAGALAARGIRPGDVVAMQVPNGLGFVIAFHGIMRAGATATTINSLYGPNEIANQLRDSHAKSFVSVSPLLSNALAGCKEAGVAEDKVIVLDGAPGHESLMDLLGEGHQPPEINLDPAKDLAVLPYSSGTTGKAKGVMLTHRNLVANVAQGGAVLQLSGNDSVMAVLPFFHIYGMNAIMNLALRKRAKLVTMPRMDLEEFLKLVAEQKCSYLFVAPPLALALAKHPLVDKYDTSSVRVIVSGAAPLDEELGKAVTKRVPARLLQGYGMTELSPVSHATPFDDPAMSPGSIGVAVPNVEFKVVDTETGKEIDAVSDGRTAPGELLVRSPGVMAGYLGNEKATKETIESDGFLHTGDIVEVGPKGEVYVVDRLKELIKYKGYQVPPAELEAILLTHPAVADSAVVAHPDEEAGEIPRAFVVLQSGKVASPEEIMSYCAEKVAPHKKIRMLEFIDEVPKSASGKILRKDLKGRPVAK